MSDMLMCGCDCKYREENGYCKLNFKGLDLEVTDDGKGILGKCIDYEENKEGECAMKRFENEKEMITINYSWGASENPIPVKEDGWKEMCELAMREAENQSERNGYYVGLSFNKAEGKINLHYAGDGEFCYYELVNTSKMEYADGGYDYTSKSGKRYDLYECKTFGGAYDLTSDIVLVFDADASIPGEIVGFFYGVPQEGDNMIETKKFIDHCVNEYEAKREYKFAEYAQFIEDADNDILDELEESNPKLPDIEIKIGKRSIKLPVYADSMEMLEGYLKDVFEDCVEIEPCKKESEIKETEIIDSCYPAVINEIWRIFTDKVDGWYGVEFFKRFYEIYNAKDDDQEKLIYFAIDEEYKDILYGQYFENIEGQLKNGWECYKIKMTEDCALYKITKESK